MTAVCCSPFRGITTWWSARPTPTVERPSLEPRPLEEEIDFILRTADRYLSGPPRREDVLSVFAGLRPLAAPKSSGESTKEISRSHKIMVSGSNPDHDHRRQVDDLSPDGAGYGRPGHFAGTRCSGPLRD